MSGPPKTPTALLKLHGSRLIENRAGEPKPKNYTRPPNLQKQLDEEGNTFYWEVGQRLCDMQLLTVLDIEAFLVMTEEYQDYRQARGLCKKQKDLLLTTQNNNVIQNPAVGIRNKMREALKKSFAQFGMTPASRASISIKDIKEENPFAELARRGRKKSN